MSYIRNNVNGESFVDFSINSLHAWVLRSCPGFGQLKRRPLKNAFLSDIAISTSAAPTFFPAHYFETKDEKGNTRAFNLVDGGIAANNPVKPCVRSFMIDMYRTHVKA
jgi:hypothetical protein